MKNWSLLNNPSNNINRKVFLSACLAVVFSFAYGQQNLIPNNSFEFHSSSCPNVDMKITTAVPWFQPYNAFGDVVNTCSTDYFYICSDYLTNGIPNYSHGYHLPHTDSAYSGFVIYNNGFDYRENIEVSLLDTLIPGHRYCLSFYTMLSRGSKFAVNSIGAAFTIDSLLDNRNNFPPLNYTPQIDLNSIYIQDTLNWVKMEGSFASDNSYKFITIGNYRTDAQTNSIPTGFGSYNGSYIFVDDVVLCEITNASTKNDTLINSPGLVQLGNNSDTTAFYEWWPHTGIADTNAMNPQAFVSQTTTYYVRKTQCGEVSTDTIVVTVSPVGFAEYTFSKADFSLSPNPNNGRFTIKNKSGRYFSGSVQLLDLYGRLVYKKDIEQEQDISIHTNDQVSSGVYFIKLLDPSGKVFFVSKIIIE